MVFQALPLKHWDLARLAWIQGFKRSLLIFRKLFLVPKEYNAKGVALFLLGYCRLFKLAEAGCEDYGAKDEILENVKGLTALLLLNLKAILDLAGVITLIGKRGVCFYLKSIRQRSWRPVFVWKHL